MTGHTWDPQRYLTYADERGRPFVELLSRVGADTPHQVVDLGCGAGNLTRLLVERWPDAEVRGVDSSPEMIEEARRSDDGVAYEVADLRDWAEATPAASLDVLVSNATLQWVPGHLDLLPRLVRTVAPGGWFAAAVPGNFTEPVHVIRDELAAETPYAEHTRDVATPHAHDPEVYLDALTRLGRAVDAVDAVDAWETTYLHVLPGDDPVFAWASGTGARPTLQALPDGLRPEFEAEFKRRLRTAYPSTGHGVVLPFRRVFFVARVVA